MYTCVYTFCQCLKLHVDMDATKFNVNSCALFLINNLHLGLFLLLHEKTSFGDKLMFCLTIALLLTAVITNLSISFSLKLVHTKCAKCMTS